jgi:hypothetical protein
MSAATIDRDPILNARFRVEIKGLPDSGVVEVILPEARLLPPRGNARPVQYGALTLRRGLTLSGEWYGWWERASTARSGDARPVAVVMIDAGGADAIRWMFAAASPAAYAVSPLNALGGDVAIETLELAVSDLRVSFLEEGLSKAVRPKASAPREAKRRR